MPRLVLTTLGVLALLVSAPADAGAAQVVRPGPTLSSVAPRLEAPTGVAPRQDSWQKRTAPGVHLTTGAPSVRPDAPVAGTDSRSPVQAPCSAAPAAPPRVFPDARAPPA